MFAEWRWNSIILVWRASTVFTKCALWPTTIQPYVKTKCNRARSSPVVGSFGPGSIVYSHPMLRGVREDACLGSPPEPYCKEFLEAACGLQLPEFVAWAAKVERAVARVPYSPTLPQLRMHPSKWFRNMIIKANLCSVSSDGKESGSSNVLNELDLPSMWKRLRGAWQRHLSAMVPTPGDDSALMDNYCKYTS